MPTILLVDDDNAVRQVIQDYLAVAGCHQRTYGLVQHECSSFAKINPRIGGAFILSQFNVGILGFG